MNEFTTSVTTHFQLPLLESAQAQKHITVNEAISKLDAVLQLSVERSDLVSPPDSMSEGASYLVSAKSQASGLWAGRTNDIAIFLQGGWVFCSPIEGMRLFDKHTSRCMLWNGRDWVADVVALSPGGAMTQFVIYEEEHTIQEGSSSRTQMEIPDKAIVTSVTLRVLEDINGVEHFMLGVDDDPSRYGAHISTYKDSMHKGVTSPTAYYGDGNNIILSSQGDNSQSFTGDSGIVMVSLHCIEHFGA